MSFLLDVLFATISGVLTNVISAVLGVPVTVFTEFLLGLMGR